MEKRINGHSLMLAMVVGTDLIAMLMLLFGSTPAGTFFLGLSVLMIAGWIYRGNENGQ